MKNIAVFASGSGTNAENIIKYFSNNPIARVRIVMSNKKEALVLKRAEALGVQTFFFEHSDFYKSGKVLQKLIDNEIDLIVLAGFLWLVPQDILDKYVGRIINIHPALLPSYGGKGMYGDAVHTAVVAAGEKESGITVHHVNSHYDQGDIIFQAKCRVEPGDTPETLASRIHKLEYLHYPKVIEDILTKI